MARLACIDLPALPLQLLLRREPMWASLPVAVVDRDRPSGKIHWVNEQAHRRRILPGITYAAGLSLAPTLCAGTVAEAEIEAGKARIVDRLRRFSPAIEPSSDQPGVFWLDASGLDRMHPSLERWALEIRDCLLEAGFNARIAVGFSRFGTYALARGGPHRLPIVLESPGAERALAEKVRLDRLDLDPAVRDELHALGITTVGGFLRLPPSGLRKRFGAGTLRLQRLARGTLWSPLQPQPAAEPREQQLPLDDPETDVTRLLFLIKRLLHPLLRDLAARQQALATLSIRMRLEGAGPRTEHLRPAAPTLDARQLSNLVRLRLESRGLAAGVTEITLSAAAVPATHEQLSLFAEAPRRDLAAANRALARLRAELGGGAVVRAMLQEGHLPEASFRWQALERLEQARPLPVRPRSLIRRIFERPAPLPHRPRHEADGWLVRGRHDVPADGLVGPYIVAGGWWRTEVHREYYFLHNRRGEWLWVYYDRRRQRWFVQGRVE